MPGFCVSEAGMAAAFPAFCHGGTKSRGCLRPVALAGEVGVGDAGRPKIVSMPLKFEGIDDQMKAVGQFL